MKKLVATKQQLFIQRYVLTGIALGAYFGIFFRPAREPNFGFAFILGVFATFVTLGFGAYKSRNLPTLKHSISILARFTGVILTFEARHLAFDYGGRFAATLLTATAGAALGYLSAKDRMKELEKSKT